MGERHGRPEVQRSAPARSSAHRLRESA
jgi:hypothetical protein